MKLYEFPDYCTDYTPGLAVVIADSKKHAIEILSARNKNEGLGECCDQFGECYEHEIKKGLCFEVWGGS